MLSVIIPAYRDLHSIMRCLTSLQILALTQHQYLVQDDDPPSQPLDAYIPLCSASVEQNPVNLGFAGNCNAAAKRATQDILFFINQDIYGSYGLSEHWDIPLEQAFENPEVGIVGVKLMFPDGKLQHAGIEFDAKCQPTHRYLGYADHTYPLANRSEFVPAVTGAALAIRRQLFIELGGFDDTYYKPSYWEDIDLCARVVQSGYRILYQPKTTFIHVTATTGGSPNFAYNAHQFKKRWVDSGYIEPDITVVTERFW